MDLYDIAIARKLSGGGGGGGGGDSDFSIAQVTVTISTSGAYINLCVAIDAGGFAYTVSPLQESGTYSAVLYKGGALAAVPADFEYTATGSIQDYGGGMLFVTGDCTITIS